MKSTRAKVLHEISGRSLLGHVLHAVSSLNPVTTRVVVGAAKEDVIAHLKEISPHIQTIYQEARGGTGHAVKLALDNYSANGTMIVCAGDTPLLTGATYQTKANSEYR